MTGLDGDRSGAAEPPGLVWAFRFLGSGGAQRLAGPDVAAALASDEGWVWLHFSLTDSRAREWLSHLDRLPARARAVLVADDERSRLEVENDTTFGIFGDFRMEFDGGSADFGMLRFACHETLLVSARRQPLRSVETIRQAVSDGMTPASATNLVEQLMEHFCDGAAAIATQLADDLDHVEDHVVSEGVADERRHLVPIRRRAVALHRQLASLAAILAPWGARMGSGQFKLRAEALVARLSALDRDFVAVQERARLLQEEISAKVAEDTNRNLKALATMSALLLPGTLVAGAFGMNTASVPLAQTPGGFWYALLVGVLATVGFIWVLKRAGFRFD